MSLNILRVRINIIRHMCGNLERIEANIETSSIEKKDIMYRPCLRLCLTLDNCKLCGEHSVKYLLRLEVVQTDNGEVFIDLDKVRAHFIN